MGGAFYLDDGAGLADGEVVQLEMADGYAVGEGGGELGEVHGEDGRGGKHWLIGCCCGGVMWDGSGGGMADGWGRVWKVSAGCMFVVTVGGGVGGVGIGEV